MGGKSSSKSETKSQQTDRRIAATDQAQVATDGGNITNDILVEDLDADLAETAFGFAGETAEGALSAATEALKIVQQSQESALEAQAAVGELGGLKSFLSTGTAIAVVAGAAFVLSRGK
ncbi:hypothetical protein [Pelagibius sp.]|uniref:hypothetical protein n=1 Tax=Pelagibius sp. TaxID=1931238 RepID=UPI0026324FA1|nr:hypothetical protein [Pelagibius sp.]